MPDQLLERIERNLPAIPETYRLAGYPPPDPGPIETSVPLSHYLWLLKFHRWKILAFIAVCVIATFVISMRITPIYESTTTVDIDRQMPTGVIGQESTRLPSNDSDQFLATQIKLIQSDSVLRPVARKFKLSETGRANDAVASSVDDAPVTLKNLKITRPPNTYLLLISYRSPDPRLASDVSNGIARSYVEHTYNIRYRSSVDLSSFMEKQLEELKAKMERSSAALFQFEKELNVINPEEKTSILSARLLQLNTEYTNAQAERVRKETAFKSVKRGSLEAAEVSSQGEPVRKLVEKLEEAQQKLAEVKNHYGQQHPEYKKAAGQVAEIERAVIRTQASTTQRVEIEFYDAVSREETLAKTVGQIKAEFDRLNARSFEYQSLKREAEADKKLYEELIQKIKEAGINASFQNSSIRIADPARPGLKPVSPNVRLNTLLAFIFSTLLAVGAAVISDVLDDTVKDPEQAARSLNTEVIGSLPIVKFPRSIAASGESGTALMRSSDASQSAASYEEAIRTLRNSILLTNFDRSLRSLLITSAAPGEGKSTVAANLATAHASQQNRTLLIDGDLRRPSVHKQFKIPNTQGLSDVLLSRIDWRSALVSIEGAEGLHVLPAGAPSRNAGDLVGTKLAGIIDEACAEYDLVILDSPPLLGFPEPLQMATAVDGVIVVTRAGETSRKAVASVVTMLTRLRANLLGIVLNKVNQEMSDSYYYYSYHGNYYKADQEKS
jgi:capsular exopolysaccharide synthesis family protein